MDMQAAAANMQAKMESEVAEIKRIENGKFDKWLNWPQVDSYRVQESRCEQGENAREETREWDGHGRV